MSKLIKTVKKFFKVKKPSKYEVKLLQDLDLIEQF